MSIPEAKWKTVLGLRSQNLKFFLEIVDAVYSGLKKERGRLTSYKCTVQKTCPSNAERHIQVLEQHMLPSGRHLFQGVSISSISATQYQTTFCTYYSSIARDQVLACLQSRPENMTKRPGSVEQLKTYIKKEWAKFSLSKQK